MDERGNAVAGTEHNLMPYAFTMKLDAKYVKTSFENEEVWQQVEQEWKGRRWPISYSFGHPIDVEALGDVRVQITSAHKTLPPMFPAKFRDAVSQTIRDYIETVDAGIHQFIPMNVTLKSGESPPESYYLVNICQVVDAVDALNTTARRANGTGRFLMTSHASGDIFLYKEMISNLALWMDEDVAGCWFMSNSLHEKVLSSSPRYYFIEAKLSEGGPS